MSERKYVAAFDHFDDVRDERGRLEDRVLPADPGLVHAAWRGRSAPLLRGPEILEQPPYATALCGRTIKVLLPVAFDPGEYDACQRCVGAALRNELPPALDEDSPDTL